MWPPLTRYRIPVAELNAPVKPQLADDETIINSHYMRQLLEYGIRLGAEQGANMSHESLVREGEVCTFAHAATQLQDSDTLSAVG